MHIKDFLSKHPELTAVGNQKVSSVLEKTERMAAEFGTLDSNQRAIYYYTTDNMTLGLVARAVGIEAKRPDKLHPHYHIFLTHEKGGIFLQGPVMKSTIQFDEI